MGFRHPAANSHLKAACALNEVEERFRFNIKLVKQRMGDCGIRQVARNLAELVC